MTPSTESQLLTDLATIKTTLAGQDKVLSRLDYTINGNGQPGLKTIVDRHEQTFKWAKRFGWAVITPAVVLIVGGAGTAVVYLIRQIH